MITGLALINEVEDRLGWRQTDTLEGTQRPETRKLVRLLNRVLSSLQSLDDWPLLRADGTIQLVAAETGTAYLTLVNGSATVALGASETTLEFNETMINRAIQLGDHETLYRVESVETSASLTLNRPWLGDDATDEALTYTIVQDRYVLPEDFDRPTDSWENFFGSNSIDPVGPNAFLENRRNRGSTVLIGDPDCYTVYGLDPSETFQVVHFDPYPEYARILAYTYQKNHPTITTDEDRVLFPKTHEGIIIEAMLHLANRDYEDAQKVTLVLQDYIRTLNTAQGPGNVAQDKLRFTPSGKHRMAQYARWGGHGRINWGDSFDDVNKIGF